LNRQISRHLLLLRIFVAGIGLDNLEAPPIGANCRLSDRPACPQRAAPPALRALGVDESTRSVSPFPFRNVSGEVLSVSRRPYWRLPVDGHRKT
jgi:hypothetical protein